MIRSFALAVLSVACLSAVAQTAIAPPSASALPQQAPQSPYYIGVQQSFTHESNPAFAPSGTPKFSDWFSTTTLRAGANQPISRQRFFADGELRYNKYAHRDELNSTGYSLTAGIDWATIDRISGTLTAHADRGRSRAIFPGGGAAISLTNIERSEELRALGRIGGPTAITFELGGSYRQVDLSEYAFRSYKRTGVHGAVLYRLSSATTIGTGIALARTKYESDTAGRKEAYVQGSWTPSSATDVQVRLGATSVRYDVIKAQDFKGLTGNMVWNWRPTAKIAVATTAARDVGSDIGYLRLTPGQNVTAADFSSLTNTLGVRATYEATAKILVDTGLSWSRRNIDNLFLSTNRGSDTSTVLSLGARWFPIRSTSLGCQVSREQRNTQTFDLTNTAYSRKASNELIGCFGAFTLY